MPQMSPDNDFSPKLLVLGRRNTTRSIILEALLEEAQNRFGVESAGFDPAKKPDPRALKVLDEMGLEEIDLRDLESTPISAALNEHIKLVIYLSPSIKEDAPIIATAGDKVTLDVPPVEPDDEESLKPYRDLLEDLRNRVDEILEEELGLTA